MRSHMSLILKEIKSQNLFDLFFLICGISLQLIVGISTHSSLLSIVSGVSGIIAVILCAQRKLIAYPFCFLQLFTYIVLAYQQKFYGEIAENIFYFITMIFGIYWWWVGYDKKNSEIKVKSLSPKLKWLFIIFTILFTLCLYSILINTDDTQPLLDAVSTIPALSAQLLLMARYKENWYYWLVIDLASIVMWSIADNWVMVVQFIFWSINCIYGIYKWRR